MYKNKIKQITIFVFALTCLGSSSSVFASAPGSTNLNCDSIERTSGIDVCWEAGNELIIEKDGLGVEVPARGSSSEITFDYTDGTSESLSVTRDSDGSLAISSSSDAINSSQTVPENLVAGLGSSNCGSPFDFIYSGKKPAQSYNWWYKPSGEPNGNSLNRIGESFITWKSGVNRCNSTIIPNSYSSNYEGISAYSIPIVYDPDVSPYPYCVTPQSAKDLVGWGFMPSGVLGATCRTNSNQTTGAYRVSIMFNSNTAVKWYAGFDPQGCSGDFYDLKGVATHEVGHSLGLAHVDHSGQTMRNSAGPWDKDLRGLGYGDVHGAATLYPIN